ncbi:hypothetical protein ZIOFF_034784 [Zingiber officinale]|uniref:Protein kinase domain-containing protein n=1 Tax=Zingiber officinale TaxID=94328 RepID=A0A8J5G8G0_ZINOF|nr:hypothetical protein ZIOFF_034784 [Zingiber officinale]
MIVVVFVWWCIWKRHPGSVPDPGKRHLEEENSLYDTPHPPQPDPLKTNPHIMRFPYSQLIDITNNFARIIGKGGFGVVFRGCLETGKQVAVKLHFQSSPQGEKQFVAEVQNLTRIHHMNLVELIGYCIDGEGLALVYEYMDHGSLHDHLRGKAGRALSWSERLKIAIGAAEGLEYLHHKCHPPIIHRDIKSSNILLGPDLEAKIADFGLSKAYRGDDETNVSTNVVGTPGYVDPEYHNTLQLTAKSDVYSFGVLLFELLTGQLPLVPSSGKPHIMPRVTSILVNEPIDAIMDPRLGGQFDANSAWKVEELAEQCTQASGSQRPTMTKVILELKDSLELEAGRLNMWKSKVVEDGMIARVVWVFPLLTSMALPYFLALVYVKIGPRPKVDNIMPLWRYVDILLHNNLVRTYFLYDNYDRLCKANTIKPLEFDVYIDVNMPMTMSIQNESVTYRAEVLIVAVANNSVSICLVSDSTSFISIDCGISDGTSYVDSTTGLTYVSDNAYIDSGKDYNIDSTYLSSFRQELTTLRSFPDSTRSCYTLRPVVQYYKYLVRAYFLYGNYDGLHRANTLKPLEFDVYIDVNMLMTMSIQNESITYRAKALIVAVANNSVSICLVNTGNGVPFISSLELRPMDSSLYTLVNNNFYLQVYARLNLGATQTIRYPTDPYDRIWREWTRSDWTNINTTQPIQYFSYDDYRVPEAVMQTAVIPSGVGGVTDIEFYWDFADTGFRNNRFYATLFFSEFDALLPNQSRAVDIFLNGYNCFADYPPSYLWADVIYSDGPLYQNYTYRWEIKPNDSFNLPPILNAVEVFSAMYLENVTANERDGYVDGIKLPEVNSLLLDLQHLMLFGFLFDAINTIKAQYKVKKQWTGDPCSPVEYRWAGLDCSYISGPPRITAMNLIVCRNLSSSDLTGEISPSFSELSAINYL